MAEDVVDKIEKKPKKKGGKRPGAGMPKGKVTQKVLEREASRKAFQQLVLENLRPLFHKQLWLSMGQTYIYRKEKHGTGASMRIEHVLLENPHEIADALDTIANMDEQDENEGFVYIVTKPPENRAIDSMLDRSIGKASDKVEPFGTDGGEIVVKMVQYGSKAEKMDS